MRVLIVDDDPEILLLTGHVLRGAGYEVVDAGSGAAARAVLPRAGADVILMDVMLGDEDGVALGVELVSASPRPARLVFLTGSTRRAQHERMAAAGAAGVLQKPFDPATLVASLETILGSTS